MRKPFRVCDDMRSLDKKRAVAAYTRAGLSVLILHGVENGRCTCGNAGCNKIGKHPITKHFPEGFKSATRNLNRLLPILREVPNSNIGIVPAGPLLVLDIDGEVGEASILPLELPRTTEVKTGRGRHMYFWCDDAKGSKIASLPGVDIRADNNGYLVAPPSVHVSGRRYSWRPDRTHASPLSASAFLKQRRRTSKIQTDRIFLSQGNRNNTLASFAGFFRSKGFDQSALATTLRAINTAICLPPLSDGEVDRIAQSISAYELPESPFGDMADVKLEPVLWLVRPYIPLGVLTMLDGDPGIGKSSLVAAIVAAVTRGGGVPWSSDTPKGGALIAGAEDDTSRILRPRLEANNADLSPGVVRFMSTLFSLDEKGVERLKEEVATHRPILVVIDPIVAFIGQGEDLHKASDMTRFLNRIADIASEFDCAIVIVRHLRKSSDGDALRRGLGSIAIAGRVRSVLAVARHPDDPQSRVMAHVKSNYAREGATVLFSLVQSGDVSRVEWLGVDENLSASALFQVGGEPGRPPTESAKVRAFLETQLSDGACASSDVFRAAATRGLAKITVERTSREMKVVKTRKGRESYWQLPADYVADVEDNEDE